ncbi:MAG: LacI family transcriptional regulator [Epulopiscium sp. Nele67-Bin005]|nr:MAG: LacI family transcriptional regulator [Epulopiscium sp. Nele67-Bin005]
MNIKDIARLANVGVSTVSRVLNNHPDVKEETRQNILKIMKENNYIPNNSARILKSSNQKTIGVLVKGIFNPFFAEMLEVIQSAIGTTGYDMIVQHYDYNTTNEIDKLVAFIKEKRLQGVICLGGNFDAKLEDYLKDLPVTIVLASVDTKITTPNNILSVIGIDNEKAGYIATKYLIDTNHKNIAIIIGDSSDKKIGVLRQKGYEKALKEANLTNSYIIEGDFKYDIAYKKTKQLLLDFPEITAIFAISDIMAIGACKAILDSGRTIPKDVSVMGFDGMDIGQYYNPPITTIKQPMIEMASLSVDILLDVLHNKSSNKQITLETKLIKRDSAL